MSIINVVINLITFCLGIILGFYLNKRLSDRSFLVNEIYSPLYDEVKVMGENISEFKDCFFRRRGHPDFSAPLSSDKIPGNVRTSLIRTGKYAKVSRNLRTKLDNYYNESHRWNLELENLKLSPDYREGKIKEKQQYLRNLNEELLRELQDKIREPTQLFVWERRNRMK